jgi:hypothetical protein
VFREVNEQIASMTLVEYEALRAEPTRFAVLPGHEVPTSSASSTAGATTSSWRRSTTTPKEVARASNPRT